MTMDRLNMIDRLVQNDINDIEQEFSNGESYFLDNILRSGWKGYHEMTDQELENEYQNREFEEQCMNKYIISGVHTEYLPEVEIVAENEAEAKEKYDTLWSSGSLPAVGSNIKLTQIVK